MPDPRVQAGAPASAAAADGPAGEPRRPGPAGEDHQHHAGHHHCHSGVRLHRCQVCCSANEEPLSRGSDRPGGVFSDHILEELGPVAVYHRPVIGAHLTEKKTL